jgi:hypothetical protein
VQKALPFRGKSELLPGHHSVFSMDPARPFTAYTRVTKVVAVKKNEWIFFFKRRRGKQERSD